MEKYQDNSELEDMRQQIQLLKDKLAKETIISEKMIRQSTREKLAYINRKNRIMYMIIPFALIYCNVTFIWLEYSWLFCIVTSLFLVAAFLFQRHSHKGIHVKRITTDSLLDVSKALIRMNRLGVKWFCFGIPFALLWIIWFMMESYPKEGGTFICYGGAVGFAAGAIIGLLHTYHVRRKAKEAIRDIEEYTQDC